MIFYLVPATESQPAKLEPTQADANREAKARGLKVRAPDMEHNVPTVKAELMDYINDLLAQSPEAHPMMIIDPESDEQEEQAEQRLVADLQNGRVMADAQRLADDYTSRSIAIDEEWEKLPLARKLCFAASALEDARRVV